MAEVDLNGVFVSGLLICAVIAYAARMGMTRLLARVGFYRLVWHRPLFDFALFVILLGAVSAVAFRLAYPHAEFS
jgi:hypothetical protein